MKTLLPTKIKFLKDCQNQGQKSVLDVADYLDNRNARRVRAASEADDGRTSMADRPTPAAFTRGSRRTRSKNAQSKKKRLDERADLAP